MRIATIRVNGEEQAAFAAPHGMVSIETVNASVGRQWATHVLELLLQGQWESLAEWYRSGGEDQLQGMPAVPEQDWEAAPLYRFPRKILGVGLNYVEYASQLTDVQDEEPVTFMKPDTALIGPGDPIVIPVQSNRTTAEAELAIVIGKPCRDIVEEEVEASGVIAGYTTSLDVTAADIHGRNPRFLARAKSFDTFFSFGSQLVTPDEIGSLPELQVSTVLNGEVCSSNKVGNMRYNPWFQVAFFSQVMTLLPGDIILTGTPGSTVIREGDKVECRIEGFPPLTNPVKQSRG